SPDWAALRKAAEDARLIIQVRGFLSWVGDGRKLTQTGRIGLADGRRLVELLDTGDTINPVIGEHVHNTRSSEELGYLNRLTEWAKAAHLVRVASGKLVPVKKNAALTGKPLELVLALVKAYPDTGAALIPVNQWRQSFVSHAFSSVSNVLLRALAEAPAACTLTSLADTAYKALGEWRYLARLTDQQRDRVRRMTVADVRTAMAALHVLGVSVLERNSDEVDEHGYADWSKGTAELTDLGRYAIRRVYRMP
ncbi:MAG: hypothetical protein ACRDN0_10275, partial [Trebonia sp.]